MVDWLGRGGIAHCTEAWALELRAAGVDTTVVTRPGRELGRGHLIVDVAPPHRTRLAAHRAVATHAADVIDRLRPSTVVVQNYVIPAIEAPVYRAAERVGAQLVIVVHDHRPHSRLSGSTVGLRRLLARADTVVVHSQWVGDACHRMTRRTIQVIPVPVPLGLLCAPGQVLPFAQDTERNVALHFGILRRGYKGTETVVDLARSAVPGWDVAAVGVGAPRSIGLISVNRFVAPGELVASVQRSAAALLPYRFATQSGAIVLAQALRSVPLVTAVGGIPEQVEDGMTGRLLPVDAPVSLWRSALAELCDAGHRRAIADRAYIKVWDDHARFRAAVHELVQGAA